MTQTARPLRVIRWSWYLLLGALQPCAAVAQDTPATASPAPVAASPSPALAAERQTPPRERAWQILVDALNHDSAEKRAKAADALGLLKGNAKAESLAKKALKDEKPDVRAAAARALGSIHATGAQDQLEAALDDKEPAVVLAAANSLLQLQDTESAYDIYYGVLTGTVRTDKGAIKQQVKDQLKTLHDKKKMAQLGLEQGIGFIPYGGIGYGVVKSLIGDDHAPVRAAAAKKLAHDPDPVTANALVDATHDKSWLVRMAALEALSERGDRALISKVVPAFEDDKEEVRYTAAACVVHLSALRSKPKQQTTAALSSAPN